MSCFVHKPKGILLDAIEEKGNGTFALKKLESENFDFTFSCKKK